MAESVTPSGYIIQEAVDSDAEGIAYVHVKSWQTSYAGLIDQSYLDNISYEKRLDLRKEILASNKGLQLVVVFDGQIIGFADVGPLRPDVHFERYKDKGMNIGEIYAIYLLEEHKKKGLGKSLFKRCRLWLDQQEFDSFIVWVLADNRHAKRFYEREGGEVIGEVTINIGDKDYQENCYLFPLL